LRAAAKGIVNVSQDPLQVGLQEIKRIIVEQEQYTALLKKRLESIEGLLKEGVK